MNIRKTTTSTETGTGTGVGDSNNVTHLDEIRRTRKAAEETVEIPKARAPVVNPPIGESSATGPAVKKSASTRPPIKKNRRFDQEKVERLKARIASGDYEVDAERVAHKFIESDRH